MRRPGTFEQAEIMSESFAHAVQRDSHGQMLRPSIPPRSLNFSAMVTPIQSLRQTVESNTYASAVQTSLLPSGFHDPILRPTALNFSETEQSLYRKVEEGVLGMG